MSRSLLPSEVRRLLDETSVDADAIKEAEELLGLLKSGKCTGFVVIRLRGDDADVRSAGTVRAGDAKFAWDVWYQSVVEQALDSMDEPEEEERKQCED